MTTKQFLEEYRDFAIDAGLSKNSADQYKSYLTNACKKIPVIKDHLEYIAKSSDADVQAAYAEQINAAITLETKKPNSTVTKKKLSDYKSAVNLLVAYLSGQGWVKSKGPVMIPALTCVSEYTRKDLKRIFLSRLNTQDRMSYSYGVFAVRILRNIAKRHKVNLFSKMIENIKFLYGPSNTSFFCLKNIDKLIIATDGHAYIEKSGMTYPVYTEVFKQGQVSGFEIANVSNVRQLSLDHDTPMVNALEVALDNMPEYKKLSDSIMIFKTPRKKEFAAKISADFYNTVYPTLNVCEATVLSEIVPFIDSTQLTVMQGSYNSSKSKNTP